MSTSKAQLRKTLLALRRSLPVRERERWSAQIAATLNRVREFKHGARIAVYLPIGGEVDTSEIIRSARLRGVSLFAPRIVHMGQRKMRFVSIEQAHAGLSQTPGSRSRVEFLSPRWLDAVLLPLVGFDARGSRLGMGAGFYDRALQFRRSRRAWRGPNLIGLAFECQRAGAIDAKAWDIRMDSIITERGLSNFLRGET